MNKNQKLSPVKSPPTSSNLEVNTAAAKRGNVNGNKIRGITYSLAESKEATTERSVPIETKPIETAIESINSLKNTSTEKGLIKIAVENIITAASATETNIFERNFDINIELGDTLVKRVPYIAPLVLSNKKL